MSMMFERLVIKYLRLITSIVAVIMLGPDKDTKSLLMTRLEGLAAESAKFLKRR